MAGTPLAEAFVRVRALTDKFKDDVEKGFAGLGDDFGKQFSRDASARLRAEQGRFASAGRDIGDAAGDAAGEAFGRGMAEQGAVQFGADGNVFVRVGQDIGDDAGAAAGEEFGSRFTRDAQGRLRDERGRFVAEGRKLGEDTGGGFNDGFSRRLSTVSELGRRALALMVPSLGSLSSGFSAAASAAGGLLATGSKWGALAAGVATLGAAAASAAGYTVALAAALAPVGGLLAALPGIALTGAAAFGVWKLAAGGLGEAMSAVMSGDPKAIAAAMSKLTDSGRSFISEFEQLLPQFNQFKALAQDPFLEPLIGQMGRWLTSARGLGPAIGGLAGEFGTLVRTALDFATSSSSIASFNTILGNTQTLAGALRAALQPLLRGFVDLGTVGSSWLAGMSGGLQDVLTRFGEWMSRISASGEALAWMDGALVVLKQLGSLIRDVWDIFDGLMDAARTAGGDVLGVLGQLVDGMAKWVKSAEGQDVLVTIFEALNDVGKALLPVVKSLAGAIAAIAPEAAKVATALGPVLASAITALGDGIAAMGPGLVAMVEGFGRMVAAIGPLEPLGAAIGQIFAELGGALALIVPELAEIALALAPALAAALRALGPALAALGPGLVAVAQELSKAFASPEIQAGLLTLGKGISAVLIAAAPLLPVIAQLAGVLAQVLGGALTNLGVLLGPIIAALGAALEPALRAVSDALTLLIPLMEPVYRAFGEIGAALLTQLLPPLLDLVPVMINSLIPAFAEMARQVQPLIPLLADLAVKFINDILPALLPILPALTEMSLEFTRMGLVLAQLVADVAPFIERLIAIFQHLYDTLVGHSIIPDLINEMTKWFRDGVQWISDIVGWFGDLPGLIGGWLGSVLSNVQDRWTAIRDTIGEQVEGIRRSISNALDSISSTWTNGWSNVTSYVSNAWSNIRNAVGSGISSVLGTIAALPGQISNALGDLSGHLYGAGQSMMQGLINGLYSMWQTAYNAASDILNHIRNLFPFSPAKEGPFSGKGWTLHSGRAMISALADGVLNEQGAFTSAMDQVMRAGADALAPSLAVPGLSAMVEPTSAPGFAGSFGAAAAGAGAPAGRSIHVENIVLQGVFDPTNPVSYRRMVERLREAFIELEQEGYVNG